MVTRPLMDSIASITRPSWRNGVGSTHWLRQAKRTIMSGMGGCSSCRLDWGIHSLHGARSPCLMWVDDAVGLSHLRFGEGIEWTNDFLVKEGWKEWAAKLRFAVIDYELLYEERDQLFTQPLWS